MHLRRLGCLAGLALAAAATSWCWKGPTTGRVALAPGHDPAHAAVSLRCRTDLFHGESTVGDAIVHPDAMGRFLVRPSFRGPLPNHCTLEVLHPLYVAETRFLRRWIFEAVGSIEPVPWSEQLMRGGEDHAPTHAWPEIPFRGHLASLRHTWLGAFAGQERRVLARYLPELRELYERA